MTEKENQPIIGRHGTDSKPYTRFPPSSASLKPPRLALVALFLILLTLSFVALRLGLSGSEDDPIGLITDQLTDTFSYGQPDYGDGLTVESLEALKADGVTSFNDGQPEKETLDSLLHGNVSVFETEEGPYSFSEELGEVDWDALLRAAGKGSDTRGGGGDYTEGSGAGNSSSTTTTTTTLRSNGGNGSSRRGAGHSLPRFAFGIFGMRCRLILRCSGSHAQTPHAFGRKRADRFSMAPKWSHNTNTALVRDI